MYRAGLYGVIQWVVLVVEVMVVSASPYTYTALARIAEVQVSAT